MQLPQLPFQVPNLPHKKMPTKTTVTHYTLLQISICISSTNVIWPNALDPDVFGSNAFYRMTGSNDASDLSYEDMWNPKNHGPIYLHNRKDFDDYKTAWHYVRRLASCYALYDEANPFYEPRSGAELLDTILEDKTSTGHTTVPEAIKQFPGMREKLQQMPIKLDPRFWMALLRHLDVMGPGSMLDTALLPPPPKVWAGKEGTGGTELVRARKEYPETLEEILSLIHRLGGRKWHDYMRRGKLQSSLPECNPFLHTRLRHKALGPNALDTLLLDVMLLCLMHQTLIN